MGPPPPKVVADVPVPLDPNGELVDPGPEVGEDPNIDEPVGDELPGEDPKLEPELPKLEPELPKLDPDEPKLELDEPNPDVPESPPAPD
jgi:hypothetical protein